MSKSKSGSPAVSEVRFISSLPLDEAVQVMGALASENTPVTLTEINPDTWQFTMHYDEPGTKIRRITVVGTLCRWNGTYTRVDCIRLEPKLSVLAQAVIAFFLATHLYLGIEVVRFILRGPGVILTLLSTIPGLYAAVMIYIFVRILWEGGVDQRITTPTLRYFERKNLFEDILRAFRLAGDVSQDEDNLDATDDPGMEAIDDNDPFGQYSVIRQRK
jgi:hypothetical protein